MYLFRHSLMRKSAQNNSSNGGPDAALRGYTSWLSQCCSWSCTLEFILKSHWRCITKWQKDVFDIALEGVFVSAIVDTTEGSSESTPKFVLRDLYKDAQEGAFEVKINGELEVTMELHLKMHMGVHLLGYRSSQNDSIKRWTWGGNLCCTSAHLRFHLRKHLKMHKIVKKRCILRWVDDPLDSVIKG